VDVVGVYRDRLAIRSTWHYRGRFGNNLVGVSK
jgi:hypothetical protein